MTTMLYLCLWVNVLMLSTTEYTFGSWIIYLFPLLMTSNYSDCCLICVAMNFCLYTDFFFNLHSSIQCFIPPKYTLKWLCFCYLTYSDYVQRLKFHALCSLIHGKGYNLFLFFFYSLSIYNFFPLFFFFPSPRTEANTPLYCGAIENQKN